MFKNYLKIAWRNLKTDRMFSVLNVLGLSIGLTIAILLFAFIAFELSFDQQYAKKDAIYRVLVDTKDEVFDNEVWCRAPAALAPALENDAPDVAQAARMLHHNFGKSAFVNVGNINFSESRFFWCDPELFSIFELETLAGDALTGLKQPNTVALSESTARKYFGSIEAIGKTIKVDDRYELEVTAVFKDFPSNSTLEGDLIGSFATTKFAKRPQWGNSSFETYLLLNKNASIVSAEKQLQQVLDKNVDAENQWFTFSLQPLEKIHLYSAGYAETNVTRIGDINEIRNLSILGLIILIIACVNYMNLMTARSQKRSKDVGINKTLGASVQNLIARFYAETGLITLLALVIGLIMAILLMPMFNMLTDSDIHLESLFRYEFLIGLFLFWAVTTLISGSYPAFYLASFSPKTILSQKLGKSGNGTIRKGLVVLQFASSVVLIIGVLVVYQQTQFMMDKNLGYSPENVVAIATGGIRNETNKQALLQEFSSLTTVSKVGLAQGFPGLDVSGRSLFRDENDEQGLGVQTNVSDASITEVLQLKILAGKPLPEVKQEGDTITDVVLNKKAIEYLGYSPEEAIGKRVNMMLGNSAYISGVVDDFNFESLHQPIGGYAFHNGKSEPKSYVLVRLNSAGLSTTMRELETIFQNVVPNSAFEYTFLDKKMEALYARERKAANIGLAFCLLAIFIACLGLFGLAAYTAEQRKKEIGVRKVLGASIFSITEMLSKDFLKLVLIALGIAFPIAFFIMRKWLEAFAYRIEIGWSVFLTAAMVSMAIALFTVSFQAIRAANANPIRSLRTE